MHLFLVTDIEYEKSHILSFLTPLMTGGEEKRIILCRDLFFSGLTASILLCDSEEATMECEKKDER